MRRDRSRRACSSWWLAESSHFWPVHLGYTFAYSSDSADPRPYRRHASLTSTVNIRYFFASSEELGAPFWQWKTTTCFLWIGNLCHLPFLLLWRRREQKEALPPLCHAAVIMAWYLPVLDAPSFATSSPKSPCQGMKKHLFWWSWSCRLSVLVSSKVEYWSIHSGLRTPNFSFYHTHRHPHLPQGSSFRKRVALRWRTSQR